MSWFKETEPEAEVGSIRIRSKILLFPRCFRGEFKWLTRVNIKEEYGYNLEISCLETHKCLGWFEIGFVD